MTVAALDMENVTMGLASVTKGSRDSIVLPQPVHVTARFTESVSMVSASVTKDGPEPSVR